jgi:hypothetical protein
MRKVIVGTVAVTALLCTAAASAGGWATVAMSSHPSNAKPGKPWGVDLTVLQHGRTPLAGVRPILTIRDTKTGAERDFPAKPTEKVGVYRATVVFPRAGAWDYEIDDGFSQVHTYAPVTVGEPAVAQPETPKADAAPKPDIAPDVAPAAESSGSSTLVALVAVAVAFALAAGAMLALRRQRQPGAGV